MGWAVFFDFDGTLTTADLVEGLLRHFKSVASQSLIRSIKRGELSLRTGIALLYDLLPTSGRQDYQDWVMDAAVLRPGLDHLLTSLRAQGIPGYVLSNGLDAFIETVVAGRFPAANVYCNRADWRGPRLRVQWPFPCHPTICVEDCGLCKPTVMKQLTPTGDLTVLVGDGITDVPGAFQADLVFARDHLATYLSRRQRPFYPYHTFDDVQAQLWPLINGEQEGVLVS